VAGGVAIILKVVAHAGVVPAVTVKARQGIY